MQFCDICGYRKMKCTTNFFSSLFFVAVFGSGIRDPGWIKISIRDKHPGSATLHDTYFFWLCRNGTLSRRRVRIFLEERRGPATPFVRYKCEVEVHGSNPTFFFRKKISVLIQRFLFSIDGQLIYQKFTTLGTYVKPCLFIRLSYGE